MIIMLIYDNHNYLPLK